MANNMPEIVVISRDMQRAHWHLTEQHRIITAHIDELVVYAYSLASTVGLQGVAGCMIDRGFGFTVISEYEDAEGYTFLMRAIEEGNIPMLDTPQANLRTKRNKYGLTALDLARKVKNERMVRRFEEAFRAEDENIFIEFARTGDLEKVREYLTKGGDVNAIRINERTALFEACLTGNLEMVTLLLEHRADPRIIDARRRTALEVTQNPEIRRLIAERVEELNQLSDARGRTTVLGGPAGPGGPVVRGGNRKSARKTRRQRRR
jgi:hypothetical protein